jgi:hypothetical protein
MEKFAIRNRPCGKLSVLITTRYLYAVLIFVFFGTTTLWANDPLLVDAVGTATNGGVDAGNGFVINLPQAALSGNLVVCGITYGYSASRTLSIADNEGNTWHVAVTLNNGTTNTNAIVYASGVTAGTQKITFTFDSPLTSFQAACKEAYGIVTSSPVDVTSSASNRTAPNIASGSMTTTASNDLIFQYGNNYSPGNDLNVGSQLVTSLTAGSGWSPIIADTITGQFFQDFQQSTPGAITPSYTVTGSLTFSTVAVAFKTSSGAGTAPPSSGIHIDHEYTVVLQGNTNGTVEFPSDGNFLAVTNTNTPNTVTVTDSIPNTYVENEVSQPEAEGITWYATNATTSPTLAISLTNSGSGLTEFVARDIRGVATNSPLDTTAGNVLAQTDFSAGSTVAGPTITPAAAGELLILTEQNGCGPPQYVSTPSGATMDNVWFTGQVDADTFDEGEGHAHFITTGTSPISVTWVMQNTGCSGSGNFIGMAAWLFKPGSQVAAPDPPTNLQANVN